MVDLALTAQEAVAFRARAHRLDGRLPAETPLADAASVALPDYPKGAALRGLAIRRSAVDPGALDEALEQGTLVRAMSLRGTTHVFAEADSSVFMTAVLPTPSEERAVRDALGSAWLSIEGVGIDAIGALALVTDQIGAVVADERPRNKGAISEALHGRVPDGLEPWCERCQAQHVPEQVFRFAVIAAGVRFAGDGADLVAGEAPDLSEHAAARTALVRRFLGAYGPASVRAFADWSGLGQAEAKASFSALRAEVVKVRLDGKPALALADDVERLRSPASIEGVRLVPAGDAFLQQRDRSTLVSDPAQRRLLWRPAGAPGLVLVTGAAAGTWRHKQAGSRLAVTVELWVTLSPDQRAEVETEAALLAAAQGFEPSRIELTITGS